SAGVEESQAEIYAAFARGNLGKAIYLADSEEFKQMYSEVLYLLKHLKDTDISELLDYIRKLKDEKLDISICLDFMQMWYRDVLMYKTTKDINLLIFKNEFSSIKQMSTVSGYEGLERILEAIDKARVRLGANVNMELTMELMLLTMQEN
ncbi:TPA: DNA polymerase III subunit delta, partial [Clostridioides difficile]|nr:DNA polymerase III subunit delta [Clostridioides difficile]